MHSYPAKPKSLCHCQGVCACGNLRSYYYLPLWERWQVATVTDEGIDIYAIINGKGSGIMAVRLNEDEHMVNAIKEGLKRTGGFCPCRLERTQDNKCICKEFREQIADPNFTGYCHCMLYYKE